MKYAKILVTLALAAAANSSATWYYVACGRFSPDGSKVAYLSNDVHHGGTVGFANYTVNADGSGKVRFDLKGGVWGVPYFSPDGSKIAFINAGDNFPNRNIFLVDVDGTNLKPLTAYGDDPFETEYWPDERTGVLDEGLTFSPDGSKLFFCSEDFGTSDIFAIDVDGTGKTQLTAFADHDESCPVFLAGGEGMLFTATGSGEDAGIWTMNADGSGKRKLFSGEDVELAAVSPDGNKIAYLERRGDEYATYVADLDGSSRFKVADEEPSEIELSFSPDGKKVLYCLEGRVYVVNADGSGLKALTPAWVFIYSPAFFADGAKIVFLGSPEGFPSPINIYTMDADGSNLEPFKATEGMYTGGPVDIFFSCYPLVVSPTGDRFLFNGDYEDYVGDAPVDYFAVNVDGSGLVRLSEYNPPPYDEEEE